MDPQLHPLDFVIVPSAMSPFSPALMASVISCGVISLAICCPHKTVTAVTARPIVNVAGYLRMMHSLTFRGMFIALSCRSSICAIALKPRLDVLPASQARHSLQERAPSIAASVSPDTAIVAVLSTGDQTADRVLTRFRDDNPRHYETALGGIAEKLSSRR